MPKVLITPEALVHTEGTHTKQLRDAGFEIAFPSNPQFTRGLGDEQEGIEELAGADALIAGSEHITAWMLDRLPQLRVIARNGVGYDRVDVAAATDKNVVLTITPKSTHQAAAEHALALVLAVSRKIVEGDRAMRSGQWPQRLVEPLRKKTVGILGLGRIGRSMAIRCAAFDVNLIAHDVCPDTEFARKHQIELVDFHSLLERSDILSIHCPNNQDTRGLIDAEAFSKMKPESVLVNTARGAIINEPDLIAALQDGTIRAAALDVFAQEPPAPDNPLLDMGNVVLSPHAAGTDSLAMEEMAIESAGYIIDLYQGRWPANAVVNSQLRDTWTW